MNKTHHVSSIEFNIHPTGKYRASELEIIAGSQIIKLEVDSPRHFAYVTRELIKTGIQLAESAGYDYGNLAVNLRAVLAGGRDQDKVEVVRHGDWNNKEKGP